MIYSRSLTLFLALMLAISVVAQTPDISIETPKPPPVIGPLLRPFHLERRIVSPANLSNSPRLESLIRAGNLYLSMRGAFPTVAPHKKELFAAMRCRPRLPRLR